MSLGLGRRCIIDTAFAEDATSIHSANYFRTDDCRPHDAIFCDLGRTKKSDAADCIAAVHFLNRAVLRPQLAEGIISLQQYYVTTENFVIWDFDRFQMSCFAEVDTRIWRLPASICAKELAKLLPYDGKTSESKP